MKDPNQLNMFHMIIKKNQVKQLAIKMIIK